MMSDMLLYEADTGVLRVMVNTKYITTLRTGASAANLVFLLTKSNFKTVGLIGLGNIMSACVDMFTKRTKDRSLICKALQASQSGNPFPKRYKSYSKITFELCDTYKEMIKGSDIVISAWTRAEFNFCSNDCYNEGCKVSPIVTLEFQNCDLFFDHIYTKEIEQIRGFKYCNSFKQ